LNFVLGVIIIGGIIIISRLFYLQLFQHKHYKAQALGQQIGLMTVKGERGGIFCTSVSKEDSMPIEVKSLAINKESWNLWVYPLQVRESKDFAKLLSGKTGLKEEEILKEIKDNQSPVILKKGLSKNEVDEIRSLKLNGIFFEKTSKRFYPQGEILAQVLGFVGGENIGQYGLEGYYDEVLQGKTVVKVPEDNFDYWTNRKTNSLDGGDLYLTIDYSIQLEAERLLQQAREKLQIQSGQIIVMEPNSGKILTLANYPFFNPNFYFKEKDISVFQNGAIQKLFEPGSILKPVTMAAALNEELLTPESTYIDKGSVSFGSQTIHNFNKKVYGEVTMTQVLEESINTGAVFVQRKLGNKKFLEYLEKFSFFEKTGVDLQGEVYSRNENLKKGPDINYATASFGQGIELTPLQVARAFCVFANGGRLVKPFIVEKVVKNGEEIVTKPVISPPILSGKSISQINSMLISVVEKGFGGVAKIPGYYVAGKTGTAQIPRVGKRGYEPDKTIQSFVGYFPAFNPQFLILIKLDDPKVPVSALSAVPIFKELAQYIINHWKIPPDYSINP